MYSYIARAAGCQLDWFPSQKVKQFPKCSTIEDIKRYDAQLVHVTAMSLFDMFNLTGCQAKCRGRHFSLTECKAVEVTWKHAWSSAFYLAAEKTMVRTEEEFLVFDWSDTVNGIGGAMGLFLGWSVLCMIQQLAAAIWNWYRFMVAKVMK